MIARPDGLLILALLLALAVTLVSAAFAIPLAADDGARNPAASGGDGETFTADDIFPNRGEPPSDGKHAPYSASSVIGSDERVQLTDNTVFPWRAIAYLELYDASASVVGHCTGTFIGSNAVLTAAHCLHDPVDGWTSDVAVIPGKDAADEPYGWEWASDWWVPDGWISSGGDPVFDWGVIKMPTTLLGNAVGWLTAANLTTETLSLSDFTPAIAGYPGDKPEGTMWGGDKGSFVEIAPFTLCHDIDTAPGQSGSAIFSANAGAGFLGYIVGIHAYGAGANCLSNSGSRIDEELLNDLLVGCEVMVCSIAHYTEPLATPTAAPGALLAWGNGDCRGGVDSLDALQDLRLVAKLGVSQEVGCPRLGDVYEVMGASPHMWGDVDCDGGVGSLDALRILRYVARLDNPDVAGCPRVGDLYEVR